MFLSTNITINDATLIIIYFFVVLVVIDEVLHTFHSVIFMLGTLFDPLVVNTLMELPTCSLGHISFNALF